MRAIRTLVKVESEREEIQLTLTPTEASWLMSALCEQTLDSRTWQNTNDCFSALHAVGVKPAQTYAQ